MEASEVSRLIEVVAAQAVTIDDAQHQLAAITRIESWCAAAKITTTQLVSALASANPSISAEHLLAKASHSTLADAGKAVERASLAAEFPAVTTALGNGVVTPAHVEVMRTVTARLTQEQRSMLAADDAHIASFAAAMPPDKFRDCLKRLVNRVTDPGDDVARFVRQKAASYLRHWIDPTTGMWNLRGEFDPLTGARLEGRIRNKLEAKFHGPNKPEPHLADAGAQQDHLRAQAFIELVDGTTNTPNTRPPRAEIVIVIDHETLRNGKHPSTRLSVNNGAELPIDTIREIALHADIYVAETDRHGLPLNLGLIARTAGKYQRLALSTIYNTCAVPDCNVKFDNCQPHHIHHYENGGPTDLDNLLPLCSRHHHRIHDDGWRIEIDHQRNTTITLPDNTRMHSPPKIPYAYA